VLPDDLWRYIDVANKTRWYRVVSVARTQSHQQHRAGGDQAVRVRVTGQQQVAAKLGQWHKKFERNLSSRSTRSPAGLRSKAVQSRPWTDVPGLECSRFN
jgi:hypothetical protein